jgi:hypothetical protein
MAKVVISLTAETEEALKDIQQFTKGIQQSYDTIKAGTPTLQASTIKVKEWETAQVKARDASVQVSQATRDWASALGLLPGQLGAATTQAQTYVTTLGRFAQLAGPLAAVGVAVGGVAAAGLALAKSAADVGDELHALSQRTGVSVETLSGLTLTAAQTDLTLGELGEAISKLQRAMSEAGTGNAELIQLFTDLGVSVKDASGQMRPAEAVLAEVASGILALGSEADRQRAAVTLFGKSGAEIIPFLTELKNKGIAPLIEESRRLGLLWTDDMAQASDQFNDDLERLKLTAGTLGTKIGLDLLPMVQALVTWFGRLAGVDMRPLETQLADVEAQLDSMLKRFGQAQLSVPGRAETAEFQRLQQEQRRLQGELAKAERPPPQDTPEKKLTDPKAAAEAKRQADKAAEDAAKRADQAAKDIAQIFADLDAQVAAQVLGEDLVKPKDMSDAVKRADDAASQIAQIFADLDAFVAGQVLGEDLVKPKDLTADLQAVADELGRLYDQEQADLDAFLRSTSAGRLDAMRAEQDQLKAFMDQGLLDAEETEAAKLRIFQLSLEKQVLLHAQTLDQKRELGIAAQEDINALLELQVTQTQRHMNAILEHQKLTAQLSGDAWGEFEARFNLIVNNLPTTMDNVMQAVVGVFDAMGQAFHDTFYLMMKGDLEDLDDVWKAFFDAVLQQFVAFLASEAVAGMFQLVGALMSLGGVDIKMPSLSGGGGVSASPSGGVSAMGGAVGVQGLTGSSPLGVTMGPVGVTTEGVTVFGSSVYSWGGTAATQLAGPGSASYGAMTAMAAAEGIAAAELAAGGIYGAGGFLAAEAGATMATSSTAAAGGAMAALAPVAAVAAPLMVFGMGLMADMENEKTEQERAIANTVQSMSAFQTSVVEGTTTVGGLNQAVEDAQFFISALSGTGAGFDATMDGRAMTDQPLPDVIEITSEATLQRLTEMYGEDAAAVQQLIAQQTLMIEQAFTQQTQGVLAGETVALPTIMQPVGTGMESGHGEMTDVTAQFMQESSMILNQIEGFNQLAPEVQANFVALGASFEGNTGAMVELVQAVSEELPAGLQLSTEQAMALVEQGKLASEEYTKQTEALGEISMLLLDTTNGVGDMAAEAAIFVDTLQSGEFTTESLSTLFAALASEHGPGFTDAVHAALVELGLTNEEAALLIDQMTLTTDGLVASVEQATLLGEALGAASEIEITVPVSYEVVGDIPPGVETSESGHSSSSGPIPVPTPGTDPIEGRFHGGWAPIPGFAPGGWVTDGLGDRDSVMAMLARDEFVLNNRVTRLPGNPWKIEHLNATGVWPGAGGGDDVVRMLTTAVEALASRSGDGPETVKELKKLNSAIARGLRGPGRVVGIV